MNLNPWQGTQQIAYQFGKITWPDSPGEFVFADGSVQVSDADPAELLGTAAAPFALIRTPDLTQDDESPDLAVSEAVWTITIVHFAAADRFGRAVAMGANRASQGSTAGKGLVEIEERAFAALRSVPGVLLRARAAGPTRPLKSDPSAQAFARDLVVASGRLPTARYYAPCSRLKATGGSGQVALSWSLPPDLFHMANVVLRRSLAGGAVPATVTDGAGVTLSGPLATSVTLTGLAVGVYQFSIFTGCDETRTPPTTPDRYSAAVSTSATVT